MTEREYNVSGKVLVTIDEVFEFLKIDPDETDYEPSESDWKACAYHLFENGEIYWLESSLE